jgi:hypothetical protein
MSSPVRLNVRECDEMAGRFVREMAALVAVVGVAGVEVLHWSLG